MHIHVAMALAAADDDVIALAHDEDLTVNPFYKALVHRFPTVLEEIVAKKHLLCIPCAGAAESMGTPTLDQLETHVLCKTESEVRASAGGLAHGSLTLAYILACSTSM